MSRASAADLTNAEELLERSRELGRCELIDGKVVRMSPAGFDHGQLTSRIAMLLGQFIVKKKLGAALGAETGFVLRRNPDTVRAPDFAFVRKSRVPRGGLKGYFEGAPDLIVEVSSPSDRQSDLLEKIDDWLAAGVRSCWVVDAKTRSVLIHRSNGVLARYKIGDTIRNEPVLPKLAMHVADIFEFE